MSQIQFKCVECSEKQIVEHGEEKENDDGGLVCEDCATTSFEDLDFPIWMHWESYDDNWDMLRQFCYETGLENEDVPIARDMKYTVFSVYFKITEDGVEGPYDEKGGELI